MAKIKDIALEANLSVATVSKALHDSPEIPLKTRERVKAIASSLGYVPNAYAQALKLKRSYSIGVIFKDDTNGGLRHEYFSSILNALKVRAESRGYAITFLSKMPGRDFTYLQAAHFRNLDGIAIVSEDFNNPEIIELIDSSLPTVTIDKVFGGASAIMSDNDVGTGKLVEFAHSLGHRSIAFIHGEKTDVTLRRLASFHKGMRDMGLEVPSNAVIQGAYHDPKTAGRLTKRIFEGYWRPTCILYPDDISLLGGITALSEIGLRVPEDISVIGYDGAEISRIYRPIMTTYVQNGAMLGEKAADELISQIEDPKTFIPKVLNVSGSLQIGGTTAKIR